MPGTRFETTVLKIVDGDTIDVETPIDEKRLRILALDTEETSASSGKPVTPLGHAAKAEANNFFAIGDTVTIEFPGNEPLDICFEKYRGNFGRILVYVYKDGTDYQEHMIREGFSPYFVKYGYAGLEDNHQRYIQAEMDAQQKFVGVWDQLSNNGSEARNYATLGVWWYLRAEIIDDYRRNHRDKALNSRLDYAQIQSLATTSQQATVFTEVRDITRTASGGHATVQIGSIKQPFQLFIPDVDGNPQREGILQLLRNRYIAGDDNHPRRGYLYVTGELKLFGGEPEIIVESADQLRDHP